MMNKILILSIIILLPYVYAYETVSKNEFLNKYKQWLNNSNHSYEYTIQKTCFCAKEFTKQLRVTVIDDTVFDVREVESGNEVDERVFQQQQTISEWYELSLSMFDKENSLVKARFEDDLLYPSSIDIDQHIKRSDDEYTVSIRNLKFH